MDIESLLIKKDRLFEACSYQTERSNPMVLYHLASELAGLGDAFSKNGPARSFDDMVDCYVAASRLKTDGPSEYAQDKLCIWAGEFYNAAMFNIRKRVHIDGAKGLLKLACRCVPNYEPAMRMLSGFGPEPIVGEDQNHVTTRVSCVNYINTAAEALARGDKDGANRWLDLAAGCPDYGTHVNAVSNLRMKIQDF